MKIGEDIKAGITLGCVLVGVAMVVAEFKRLVRFFEK